MADTQPPKRHRDDDVVSDIETTKRLRNSYEPQETTQDLLDFFTSLSSDLFLDFIPQPGSDPDKDNDPTSNKLTEDDDEKESVIRHLLEASDDELGIPSRIDGGDGGDGGGGGGGEADGGGCGDFPVGLSDGLWELEDEAANYYTLLQSELFMQ